MNRVGIIGAGNLGTHLVQMLKSVPLCKLIISDIDSIKAKKLGTKFNVPVKSNNDNILESDILFLAVKPNNMKRVCKSINIAQTNKTIISTAAGVTTPYISAWLWSEHDIVRCMPNIPISVGRGSVVLYNHTDNRSRAKSLISELIVGPELFWVDKEEMMDVATVISGCMPAYIANFYNTYLEVGKEMGFSEEITKDLLLNAFNGTSKLLETNDPHNIMGEVASKGGATEKALEMMDKAGFKDMIRSSSFGSLDRIRKITESLD